MVWYSRYLSVFEQSYDLLPVAVLQEVRGKLNRFCCESPLVSVVVIAHNEESRLVSCLWSLSENRFDFPVELLGVSNCSSDRTGEVFERLGVKWFDEQKKGPGYARQCGLDYARGKYYLCIDADTMYPPEYIQLLVSRLERDHVSGVTGLWSFLPGAQHSRMGLFFYEFLRDLHLFLQWRKRPELCVRGMVFGFRTDYGREVGFRTDLLRGEDGSMALGLKKYGRLDFMMNRRARVVTSNGTLNADGTLFHSLLVRVRKQMRGLGGYFRGREVYD